MNDKLQTKRLYRAESIAFKGEPKLTEIKLKVFFHSVVDSLWFKEKYGTGYKMYFCGPKFYDYSFATYKEIYLLDNEHFTMSTCLHELSHSVKKTGGHPHGPTFCRRYLSFVKEYMEENYFLKLTKSLKECKVRL